MNSSFFLSWAIDCRRPKSVFSRTSSSAGSHEEMNKPGVPKKFYPA